MGPKLEQEKKEVKVKLPRARRRATSRRCLSSYQRGTRPHRWRGTEA